MTKQHSIGRGVRLFLLIGMAAVAIAMAASESASADADKKEVTIGKHMRGMAKNMKALAKNLQDPAKSDRALQNIDAMLEHMMSVRLLDPPGLDPLLDPIQRRKDYRLASARVIRELVDMEIDVLEGRNEDAVKRIMGSLVELREAAHEEFQE